MTTGHQSGAVQGSYFFFTGQGTKPSSGLDALASPTLVTSGHQSGAVQGSYFFFTGQGTKPSSGLDALASPTLVTSGHQSGAVQGSYFFFTGQGTKPSSGLDALASPTLVTSGHQRSQRKTLIWSSHNKIYCQDSPRLLWARGWVESVVAISARILLHTQVAE